MMMMMMMMMMDVPTKVGLLRVHGSTFGRMPFLLRPIGLNLDLLDASPFALTTEQRRLLLSFLYIVIIIFISGYQKGHKSPLNWPP